LAVLGKHSGSNGALLLDRGASLPLILPATLLVVVFLAGPFWYMAYTALTDLSFANPDQQGAFIGFDNFRRLIRHDDIFWHSFWLTVRFVVAAVAIEFVLGFALAWLIFRFVERQRLLTTLLLVPMMIAPIAVGLIWRLLLQGDFGMVTFYLRQVGIMAQTSAVFSSPGLVMPAIIAIDVWQWTPFVTLIMLAGLMSLPRAPFEAATMDGAGPWRLFIDVMLPLLRPIIALVLLLRGIDAFKEFDKVFLMTGGGPGTVSELLSIYAYRVNFKNWNLGYGAAVAFMVYLIVLILCSIFYKAVYWTPSRQAARQMS
jgi:multiple sugar transport system permease protein